MAKESPVPRLCDQLIGQAGAPTTALINQACSLGAEREAVHRRQQTHRFGGVIARAEDVDDVSLFPGATTAFQQHDLGAKRRESVRRGQPGNPGPTDHHFHVLPPIALDQVTNRPSVAAVAPPSRAARTWRRGLTPFIERAILVEPKSVTECNSVNGEMRVRMTSTPDGSMTNQGLLADADSVGADSQQDFE